MAKEILIIDDDEKILRIFNLLIKSFGYSPVLVDDPRVGLEILQKNPPSLIFLDLMMSPMDGFQFLEERRKIPGALKVPVVILSALKLNDEELAPYADSIAEIAIKPVEPARLKEIIVGYVG
jgi:CheY-like chemotaxis protein